MESLFRFEFLDSLKAHYAASRKGVLESWGVALANLNLGLLPDPADRPREVPVWEAPAPQPRRYTGRCKYATKNGRCPDDVASGDSPYCEFHSSLDPGETCSRCVPPRQRDEWEEMDGIYADAAGPPLSLSDPIPGGINWPCPTVSEAANVSIRELDFDYRPFYLKCSVCLECFEDPVYFWHPTTRQLCVCCRLCVNIKMDNAPAYVYPGPDSQYESRWRPNTVTGLYPGQGAEGFRVPRLFSATKIAALKLAFEQDFKKAIKTEAPLQICHFCNDIMVNPTVTCRDVPGEFWVRTLGDKATADVEGVQHVFCAHCLEDYCEVNACQPCVTCPFGDNYWYDDQIFPIHDESVTEAAHIAGRVWEDILQSVAHL
ncbi:hypothetical protein TWF481_004493 [Arthrobotrys musiformis]|uniref:RING-type domain-containing protein n=1 Tax=Arthrobotrys musiformis TaxID=47236 RepID=A0AAV9WJQ7_9PEZI